ncbi:hypothetical protein NUK32_21525, partial [Aeromonas caviae]|uniref:hypothetical protein n=1 Tax=Aeromonas caviae TaxID=648 RepID=UPI00214D4E93
VSISALMFCSGIFHLLMIVQIFHQLPRRVAAAGLHLYYSFVGFFFKDNKKAPAYAGASHIVIDNLI